MISPFVGLGIGGDYMEHHLMIQEYDMYEERWDFSLNPEIGALAKFGNRSDLLKFLRKFRIRYISLDLFRRYFKNHFIDYV